MSKLADIAAPPVSIEQAEAASASLDEQLERARKVVSDYRAALGAPPSDNAND